MPKVKDLTVEELKAVISDTVTESMQDIIEDIVALSSEEYLRSIQEAREDYKKGRVKSFEDIFGAQNNFHSQSTEGFGQDF